MPNPIRALHILIRFFLDFTFRDQHLDGVISFLSWVAYYRGISATLPSAHTFWASVLLGIAGACCHSFCIRRFFSTWDRFWFWDWSGLLYPLVLPGAFLLSMGLSLPCLYGIGLGFLGFLFILLNSLLDFFWSHTSYLLLLELRVVIYCIVLAFGKSQGQFLY